MLAIMPCINYRAMIQVRKSVAEHLYVRLLTLDNHCCYQGCDLDMAQQVIPMLTSKIVVLHFPSHLRQIGCLTLIVRVRTPA